MKKLSIIIPVYNESRTILEVLDAVKKAPALSLEKEIIVVDDFSSDGTREILKGIKEGGSIKIFFHEKNMGKGAALRTGLAMSSGDIVIVQDADFEYDPGEYPLLLSPILAGKTDVVYGSRFLKRGTYAGSGFIHRKGNELLTFLSNIFSGIKLTDMATCYKVFRSSIIKNFLIEEDRFGFCPEITAKVAELIRACGVRLVEVPISYRGRTYGEGKKIGLKDAFNAVWCIIIYNSYLPARIVKYFLSGLLIAVSQFLTIIFLVEELGFKTVPLQNLANIISIAVSLVVAFFVHSAFTWRYKFDSLKHVAWRMIYFFGVSIASVVVRIVLFWPLSVLRVDYRINVLLGILLIITMNFLGYDRLVFNKTKPSYPD